MEIKQLISPVGLLYILVEISQSTDFTVIIQIYNANPVNQFDGICRSDFIAITRFVEFLKAPDRQIYDIIRADWIYAMFF